MSLNISLFINSKGSLARIKLNILLCKYLKSGMVLYTDGFKITTLN